MRKFSSLIALLVVLALLFVAGVALAAPPVVNWWTTSSGGLVESPDNTLYGVMGQAIAGVSTHETTVVCAGYLCGTRATYHAYLPELAR
jgi:hypothetical protein